VALLPLEPTAVGIERAAGARISTALGGRIERLGGGWNGRLRRRAWRGARGARHAQGDVVGQGDRDQGIQGHAKPVSQGGRIGLQVCGEPDS
jgi:hypothetical protein